MGKYDSYVNAEGVRISKVTGEPLKKYNKVNKAYWAAREGKAVVEVQQPIEVVVDPVIAKLQSLYTEEEIKGIIGLKEDKAPVELVEIKSKVSEGKEGNTGFLICSDWHAEETVKSYSFGVE